MSKTESPQEALEQFENAVRNIQYHEDIISEHGETDEEEYAQAKAEHVKFKEEVLTWMSYIP